MSKSMTAVAIACATTSLVATVALIAGPLTPPAGPVNPSYKTLSEVEPRTPISQPAVPAAANALIRITQPGSYYLTGDITGLAARHGIQIASNDVALDLNGFSIRGVAGALGGIRCESNLRNISISNGCVRDWPGSGIDIDFNTTTAPVMMRLHNMRAISNTASGLQAGSNATVEDCQAELNGGSGIIVFSGVVSNCVARLNGSRGIYVPSRAVVTACSAFDNALLGIDVGSGSVVQSCSTFNNAGGGIQCGGSATVIGCVINNNTNSTFGALLLNNGCVARDNTVIGNAASGIQATFDCIVTGNNCDFNGNGGDGAGIVATGTRNRIEGNNCTRNDRGIDINSNTNFIIANYCSGNTGAGAPNADYDIAAGNDFGQIITLTGVGGFANTDPTANFRR